LENTRIKARINETTEVIFPITGDREVLVGSLQLILSRLKNPVPATVDLRFTNPVVK